MGSTSETGVTKITYADYVQEEHDAFLTNISVFRSSILDLGAAANPYSSYPFIDIEDAFFSAGYSISSFPSMYDMYGKFMAGLDIETLWSQNFEDTVNPAEVGNLVSAEAALLEDDIETNVIPRFEVGLRDINAVMSSSFIIGKAIIEEARVKSLAKFSAELKYRLIPVAQDRWGRHLEWNRGVVTLYAEMLKLYISAKLDTDDSNYAMLTKYWLWPFTVLEYNRAALGALQGARTTSSEVAGTSKTAKAIGGALAGVAAGAMAFPANPVVGAGGGLLVGLAAGLID